MISTALFLVLQAPAAQLPIREPRLLPFPQERSSRMVTSPTGPQGRPAAGAPQLLAWPQQGVRLPSRASHVPTGPADPATPAQVLDCNGNGVPDALDIAVGGSQDCQGDGIPDECQVAIEHSYQHDDGVMDAAFRWNHPYLAWLSRFTVVPGHEIVTSLQVAWGAVPPSTPTTIGVWSDPDGDGDPADAQLLLAVPTTTSLEFTGILVELDIPDTWIGPAGTSYFVGAWGPVGLSWYPTAADKSLPNLESWVVASGAPIDPDDLASGALTYGVVSNVDWLFRALSCPSGHCGESADADGDGVPDECQPQDCNGNGIPDEQDIALGSSADCQGDGVPDECQLVPDLLYAQDDGAMEGAVGTSHDHVAWLTRFVVAPGAEVVREVEVAWGAIDAATPVTVALWSDPDGDGDPTDARVLASSATVTTLEYTGLWAVVDVPDTWVGPAGTSFFVGVYGQFEQYTAGGYPAALDTSAPNHNSWFVSADTPIDPDNLPAGATELGRIGDLCCDGDWLLRATTCASGHCGESLDEDLNGVPDECDPQDCNGNGVPDEQDIALGASPDCQGDGVPDECQVVPDFTYQHDDGLMDGAFGQPHDHLAWLSRFVVVPGHESVATVEVAWGLLDPYTPVTLAVWSDPDGDGDPTDAQPLLQHPAYTSAELSGQYVSFNVPDTYVGSAGTSFFVGVVGGFSQAFLPAGYDGSQPDASGWIVASDGPIQPDDLSAGAAVFARVVDRDWMVRAGTCTTGHCGELPDENGNGVPDGCDPDCNGNGVPDDLDILAGTVTDCDGSGVPDECEGLADCDGNGLPDLCQAQAWNGLVGEYYPNQNLYGQPISRIDSQVLFDFAGSPPLPPSFPEDSFSVRWTGAVVSLGAGTYAFGLQHDDGARLWVDGQLLVDAWSSAGFHSGQVDLAAATQHYLVLEYFERSGDARIELHWQPPGGAMLPVLSGDLRPMLDRDADGVPDVCQFPDCNGNGLDDLEEILAGTVSDCDGDGVPDECEACEDCDGNRLLDACELTAGPGLAGQYFTLQGGELSTWYATRVDPQVDFDWGGGGPDVLPQANDFGIRWTGTLVAPPIGGSTLLHVQSDDGVRLWLDGVLLVDQWHGSSGNEYTAAVDLAAGSEHLLRLDYYEASGDARIHLRWTVPGGTKVAVPSSALRPDTDLDGDGVPDSCGQDCNLNGIPDTLDPDADCDGIPDDCEQGSGYWRFEESGGATALDSSGNGLDGTLSAQPVRSDDVPGPSVPQSGAPNSRSLDLGWIAPSTGGWVSVPDVNGQLSADDDGFTLEAWVRLQAISNTSGPDQRQWLLMKKPTGSTDAHLDYGLLVQAGDLAWATGGNGRELAFRCGDGVGVQTVVSKLRIEDSAWHFVSLAYDARAHELRFGLDGVYQAVAFVKPASADAGPLVLGAHANDAAVYNQFLRGLVDEARVSRLHRSPDGLLDARP